MHNDEVIEFEPRKILHTVNKQSNFYNLQIKFSFPKVFCFMQIHKKLEKIFKF